MIQQLVQQLRNNALQYLYDHNYVVDTDPLAITEEFYDELADRLQNCENTHELATVLLLMPMVKMGEQDRTDRWSEELPDLAIQVGTHAW